MKFKNNDILYYVCPISFIIEKVQVEYAVKESGTIYYIDKIGAYLAEDYLHDTLEKAKLQALDILNDWYRLILAEIEISNPELETFENEEDDEDFCI